MLNRVTSLLVAGAFVLSGCNVFTNQAPEAPASVPPAKATPVPQLPTVQVKRGTIVDAVKVLGRVVSSQEADLSFRNSGRIREVYVQPGDLVQAGQVLAELDQRDLPWSLAKAKLDVERQQVRLAAAQAKSVVDDTRLDELNIQASEIALKQAELGLEKARTGAVDADVKKAEADLAGRQAELDRARFEVRDKEASLAAKRSELAAKQLGPDALDLATARAGVETARIRLEQLRSGPRAEDVRAAEIALDQERTKLAKVREQPKVRPDELANAQIEVQKAQVALTKVLADIDAGSIKGEQSRDIAVRAAQTELERTQNTLNKLRSAAPAPEEIQAQEQAVRLAELSLQKTRGVQASDIEAAQGTLAAAQVRLEQVEKSPQENELAALRTQVQALELSLETSKGGVGVAESNLAAARAKLNVLTRGPLEFDIRDAQNRVALAVSGVQTARARLSVKRETMAQQRATATFDLEQLRRGLEQVRLDVANYESQTGDVKIVAPFAGRITRVAARPGDTVNAFMPLFNVSSLEGLVVKADIPDSDLARITPGMKADLTMDAYPNQTLVGTIEALPEQVVGSQGQAPDRSTRVGVQWPGPGAEMGMLARVQITLQIKPDVLMVPNGAVRVVGKRKFVEYMDGDIKRSRNVETGIQTDSDVEIVSGVTEGMVILAGQS
ncbi:MAG TPA: efflux RND transporter periplasmic adaptor subunit [Chloroflexota bacterium]|nr:efflux RND transporter periplasmic adaptor subunit [Chloroflexota bacterium]